MSPQRCPPSKDAREAAEQEASGGVFTLRARHPPARSPLLTHRDSGPRGRGRGARGQAAAGGTGVPTAEGPRTTLITADSPFPDVSCEGGHVSGGVLRPAPGTLSARPGPVTPAVRHGPGLSDTRLPGALTGDGCTVLRQQGPVHTGVSSASPTSSFVRTTRHACPRFAESASDILDRCLTGLPWARPALLRLGPSPGSVCEDTRPAAHWFQGRLPKPPTWGLPRGLTYPFPGL